MTARLHGLRKAVADRGLDAFLVTTLPNIRYLTGFSGSNAFAVVTGDDAVLVTDPRYHEQASVQAPGWDVVVYSGRAPEALARLLRESGRTGFESSITYSLHQTLTSELGPGPRLVPEEGVIEALRAFKDEDELALIGEAVRCSADALSSALGLLAPGVSEREVAAELDHRMRLAGADRPAFDTIVASGPDSAMPHAGVTDRLLAEGDPVVVDFGARFQGYCCDVTRTFAIGDLDGRAADLLQAVTGASAAAIRALVPGVAASEVDAAARGYLEDSGMAELFSHGLGHGAGLEEHERPSLSRLSTDHLEPGMVFTIEPGLYVEGAYGARLEEMVLMTEDGPEILTGGVPRALGG